LPPLLAVKVTSLLLLEEWVKNMGAFAFVDAAAVIDTAGRSEISIIIAVSAEKTFFFITDFSFIIKNMSNHNIKGEFCQERT
jgi:hypothetical protein